MANKKISEFTALTTPDNADVFPIVDTSATTTKKITWANIVAAIIADFTTATETAAGIAEIATSAEVIAGGDDDKIITPLKLIDWWVNYILQNQVDIDADLSVTTGNISVENDLYVRSVGSNYLKITGSPTGTRTITLFDSSDTVVGKATTDTLTNKSLSDTTTKIVNVSDATKKVAFGLSGITTGKTLTINFTNTDNHTVEFFSRSGKVSISNPQTDLDISGVSTITFTGTTPPSTLAGRYSWDYVGAKLVLCSVRLEYSSAGTGLTGVEFTLPSDMPTPSFFTGWGNSEFGPPANAEFYTSVTGLPVATRGYMAKNSGGSLVIGGTCSSNALIGMSFTFQYFTT